MSVFQKLAPYRIIRGFLGEEMVEQLLAYAQDNQGGFVPTRVGSGENARMDPEIRASVVLHQLEFLKKAMISRFDAVSEWAMKEMNLSPLSVKLKEVELVAHGDGAFYSRHIDTHMQNPDSSSLRVLTGVYYFHASPKRFSGGELRLHSFLLPEHGGHYQDIEPERDMLLLFPSWAPHEVRPISCPSGAFADHRFAINCWYHANRA